MVKFTSPVAVKLGNKFYWMAMADLAQYKKLAKSLKYEDKIYGKIMLKSRLEHCRQLRERLTPILKG